MTRARMMAGDLPEIILKYQRMYDENPKGRVFAPLSEAYRKAGMIDQAIELLKKGIRFHPGYALGYLGLANCYEDQGKTHLAYSTLRPLVESNRDNISLQRTFGELCLKTGNFEEALETYKFLLFLNPKDRISAGHVKNLEDQVLQADAQNQDELEKDEISKNTFETSRLLDDGVDSWEQVSLQPQNLDEGIGYVDDWTLKKSHLEESQFENEESEDKRIPIEEERVFKLVEKPATALEDGPIITFTLVDLYEKQGHIEKAIELIKKIIELNPGHEDAILKLKALESVFSENVEDVQSREKEEDLLDIVQSKNDHSQKILIDTEDYFYRFLEEINLRKKQWMDRA